MYQYKESGLRNVWLKNGYEVHKTPYGDGVSVHFAEDLHAQILTALAMKPGRLTGAELRFIRKEMELSQANLAGLIGVTAQTLALWEKSKGKITAPSERLLRLLVEDRLSGKVHVERLIKKLNELEIEHHDSKLVFLEKSKHWKNQNTA